MKKFRINEFGDAELRLDDKHTLIVHAADEGIALDVWEDGEGQSVWSLWELYNEMLPIED